MNLLEILITLCIVGLLSIFMIPNYENHLIRANRNEAEMILEKLAAALETYALENNTYENATLENLKVFPPKDYQLEIINSTKTSYSLQAIPVNSQEKDAECATLTLNSEGEKGITGTGLLSECWS